MSLGYIGYCRKVDEDEQAVLYVYSGGDWNNPNNDKVAEKAYDGELFISKTALSHKNPHTAIDTGEADVMRPCKNACIRGAIRIDYIVYRCLLHIFERVRDDGVFPESEAFIQ